MDDRIQAEKPARPKDPVALSLARNEPNPFTLQAETCSWSIVWFFVVPALLLSPCLMSAAIGAAGAGHGSSYLPNLLYPFASLVHAGETTWALLAGLLQFPVYGLILGVGAKIGRDADLLQKRKDAKTASGFAVVCPLVLGCVIVAVHGICCWIVL